MEHYTFKLPDLGEGVVEGEIVSWHVSPGDVVSEDQALVDVMTDKATVTIPSIVTGKVVRTHGQVGKMVPVGSKLVEFETSPVDDVALCHGEPALTTKVPPPPPHFPQAGRPAPVQLTSHIATRPKGRPLASPAIRRRAREMGVDLEELTGSGHGGRITDCDVDRPHRNDDHSTNGSQPLKKRHRTTEIHISGLRRRIAEKMSVSHTHIPHFSYMEQTDITELADLRRHLNAERSNDVPKLTYLPFLMLALVKAFRRHPESNAHYDDRREVVTRFDAVHLGIATQTERGLYVPVVRHVEAMDLWEAAHELRRVTQAAHHNTVRREELTGSTFTITSLGMMGGIAATPIINHPEVGILGVHKASDQAVVRNGQVVVRHVVNLSSSFDHRVLDGADGAALVQTLKGLVEHPATIFL